MRGPLKDFILRALGVLAILAFFAVTYLVEKGESRPEWPPTNSVPGGWP